MAEMSATRDVESVAAVVCEGLAQACSRRPDEVSLETAMLDLNVDSFTLVSVLIQVQMVFGIELSGDDTVQIMEAVLVADLVEHIERLVIRHLDRQALAYAPKQ